MQMYSNFGGVFIYLLSVVFFAQKDSKKGLKKNSNSVEQ